ncbi:DNA topoisomerase IB [Microbacterium ulmi]|uniref:DNA topoisomerase IB n=1 Tax=Microbacterium ulmi TaxID=179095 RepID=A0A7Y2LZW4_9MICO|nr:DNA topoisomerase IB [Microbacterium ulmi]NII69897.1 DNA topoisomerase IB [Microbacterium ulmi]NNH03817.1 DNA topoisomerase IB [Microbacterium ulmi]
MARLVRVRPGVDPGLRRVRAGAGFRYLDEHGGAVSEEQRTRIATLAIPPAWQDVWIAADPLAHIQAVGTDDAQRRQYLYHPQWRARRDRGKFARALALAGALPQARARVTTALRRESLDRERVLAVAFRLLDEAAPRVGSTRYLERHGSRGLTTLQRRDAKVEASVVTLSFPAKSGRRQLLEIDDDELSSTIALLRAGRPRSPLLWYPRGRRVVRLTASEVNAYVRTLTGTAFTAKDFRTLRGTIVAAETLARLGTADSPRERKRAEVVAVRAAADALGNTAAVARGSYVDPRVLRRYKNGRLLDLDVTPETAIRRLLGPP